MQQPVSEASRMFGERVRARRVELACSQEEIALLAGMNVSNYGKIERGQGNPEFHTIVRLASVLNTDAGNLVTGIRGDSLPEHRRLYSAQDFVRERAKRGSTKS